MDCRWKRLNFALRNCLAFPPVSPFGLNEATGGHLVRRKAVIFGFAAILSLPALAADSNHLSIDASKRGSPRNSHGAPL